jgi:SAM-dependent methyltransferase
VVHQLKQLLRSVLTLDNRTSQNFLGTWWAPLIIEKSPPRYRENLALRLLSLSPHYFFDVEERIWMPASVVLKEARRNASSRSRIADEVIRPYVGPTDSVVDYGCGPGYMAFRVARFAKRVIGCDISEGTLTCARVLNSAENIDYINSRQLAGQHRIANLVYSFAVAQHVRDSVLSEILRAIRRILCPGGILLMHIVVNGAGWKSESESLNDKSLRGRIRLKYGLNCFSRSPDQVLTLAQGAGFSDCRLMPMAQITRVDDDVARQHLLSCYT